jgi:hypothetical protein
VKYDLTKVSHDVLDRLLAIADGSNMKDKFWTNRTYTFRELFTHTLSDFARGPKNGPCILQGDLVGTSRQAKNVKACDLLMLDIDTGETIDAVADKVERLGWFAVLWNTHSHLKGETEIAETEWNRYIARNKLEGMKDAEIARQYLRNEKRVVERILASIQDTVGPDHREGGVKRVVRHDPMDRVRVLFVLSEPFVFAKRGTSQVDAIKEWKAKYTAVGELLGVGADDSCTDPSRLMFVPRIDPAADRSLYRIVLIDGTMLDLSRVPVTAPASADAWDVLDGEMPAAETRKFETPGMARFLGKHAADFEAADCIETLTPENVRRRPGGGKVDAQCPDEDAHSTPSPEDTAFVAVNASASNGAGFWMRCQHTTCKARSGLDRAYYLDRYCVENDIDVADLIQFCPNADAADTAATAEAQRAAEEAATQAAEQAVAPLTKDSSDDDVAAAMTKLAAVPKGVTRTRLERVLAKNTTWTKNEIAAAVQGEAEQLAARQVEEAAAAGGDDQRASLAEKLEEYNRRFAMCLIGQDVRIAKFSNATGFPVKFIRPAAFTLMYGREKVGGVKIAPEWLEWHKVRHYDEVAFNPEPRAKLARGTLNLWRGWSVAPAPGDWSLLRWHLYVVVCRCNPFWFMWLMSWLADMVQQPHLKKGTALVTRGLKGTGKSIAANFVGRLCRHNATTITKKEHLFGRFNSHFARSLFVLLEEVFWGGDREAESILKELITGEHQLLEQKGIDAVEVENHLHIWISSNAEWTVPATGDERRFTVFETHTMWANDDSKSAEWQAAKSAFFAAVDAQMKVGGLAGMLHDLQRIARPAWIDLRNPPSTPWLAEQIEHTMEVAPDWLRRVIEDGAVRTRDPDGTWRAYPLLPTAMDGSPYGGGRTRLDQDIVRDAMRYFAKTHPKKPPGDIGFGRFLGKYGIKAERQTKGDRLYDYEFPPLSELRKAFRTKTRIELAGEESAAGEAAIAPVIEEAGARRNGPVLILPTSCEPDALRHLDQLAGQLLQDSEADPLSTHGRPTKATKEQLSAWRDWALYQGVTSWPGDAERKG